MDAGDRRSSRRYGVLSLLALAALCAAADQASAAEEQLGTWQPHKMTLYFLDISSTYSCDGLQQAVTYLLRQVGAQLNAPVVPQPCLRGYGTPQKLAQAELNFSAFRLASGAADQGEAVPGVWRHVDLSPRGAAGLQGSDCELVNEFREDVLPLFATRDIKNHLNCIPFQEESLVYDLSFDVFMPATAPLPAGAAG